ncbi:peptide deformylase [Candidatus Campbellbacteria bacterium CG11_big_fil_rev_8_21_14_0_20_44_21]|uniref:Peptide deformylase n=1 Tax=Candidatus Campbellbacteria bacterium CG22_combo_CG10-13_8_21_14_all_43_18 TaxID=1974530 RepID=A0A2H0DXQ2_9BACT|nr:MAG: peptide deformylase [Candidatus Campbellbacteria bacterium CG22_combo_CG10-13_8_21_14_all_43_18]PIR24142.1 MAG: peptide deformylase [Candidatus Campbellbacteria bacterium CG11_big_fil_rev_8_21_14_0_20_44_21]
MKKILQIGSPVLRKKAEEAVLFEVKTSALLKILKEMKEALDKSDDGVAIAAPQIGYSKRIFLVADKIFDKKIKNIPRAYINPKILKLSEEKVFLDEGCLSVRWKYGEVERARKVVLQAYDEDGRKFKMEASGLLAQIFQHEVDHLDGILFTDRAINLHKVEPKDLNTNG